MALQVSVVFVKTELLGVIAAMLSKTGALLTISTVWICVTLPLLVSVDVTVQAITSAVETERADRSSSADSVVVEELEYDTPVL